jgi:predicted flap endonuclease-1-like 5' DNA nuclease
MRGKVGALVAAVAAAASAAGAAAWAKRRKGQHELGVPVTTPARRTTVVPIETGASAEPAASAGDAADDLTAIKGIGAIVAPRLAQMGVTTFAQIAAWTEADIDRFGEGVNVSPGRIRSEDWVGQARAAIDRVSESA